MVDVFISHHTNTSLHIVEKIVSQLEKRDVKCWYAPRNTEGDYAGSIVRAVKQCRVFVLVLNKDASESPHVLNELNLVTQRLVKKELVDVIPFHTADEEISDEANYYIGRMNWIDATVPPMGARIDELVRKITFSLKTDDSKIYLVRQNTGEKIFLKEGQFCIGTNKDNCFYWIQNNQYISKIHASIERKGKEVIFVDLRSSNHSYINSILVEPKTNIELKDGDEIMLANEKFTLVCE